MMQQLLRYTLGRAVRRTLMPGLAAMMIIATHAQPQLLDALLKAQLDSIGAADRRYRTLADGLTIEVTESLAKQYGIPTDSVYDYLMRLQESVDRANMELVAHIIALRNYPGRSLVGTPTDEVAFYVIQHSPYIRKYLPLLHRAARAGELSPTLVAMMEDRLLAEAHKEQIYGTQVWGNAVKDTTTGMVKPRFYFSPIRDAAHVNERRREVGFSTTIEQYAEEMGVRYEIRQPWWWKRGRRVKVDHRR